MVEVKEENIKKVWIITTLAQKDIEIEGIFGLKFESIYTWNIKDAWGC